MLDSQKVKEKVLGNQQQFSKFYDKDTTWSGFSQSLLEKHMNHLSSRILSPETCHSSPADNAIATHSDSDGDSIETSGGFRVGVVGVASPPPPFVSLGVKAQGLEAALCSFPVFNLKYLSRFLRHLAAKLQTRDQDIFVAYGMVHSVRN